MKRLSAKLWILAIALAVAPGAASESSDAAYQFALGKILLEEGAYKEAGESFARAVERAPDDAFLRVEYAEFLLNGGRVEKALGQLAEARRIDPSDPQVAKAYGQLQLQAAREKETAFGDARSAFEQLRRDTPGDLEAMSTLGRIYLSEQRFPEAAEVFEEALSYWPRSRSLHGSLIDALMRSGDADRAEEAIEDFLEVDASSIRARLTLADLKRERGDGAGARAVLLATPRKAGGDPDLYRRLAADLYEALEFEEALYWLDRSFEDSDGEVEPQGRFLRALLLTAVDRNDDARAELRAVLEAEPDRRDALELLVRHQLEAGQWVAAIDLLEPRLTDPIEKGNADLAMLYAEALRGGDRPEEALDWLSRVAPIEELSSRATARQAEILLSLDRGAEADELLAELTTAGTVEALMLAAEVCQRQEEYARAVPFLERVLEAGEDSLQAMFWLGAAYERSGRVTDAEAQFLRFLELEPDSAPALNYLGYMWADNDVNLAQALSYVEKAVSLDPDNGAYVDSLGWAHFRLGNFDEARSHLERAAGLVGDDAVVLEHLGDVYSALGELEDATRLYRQALDLGADNASTLRDKIRNLDER